jgi:hypothetical protein
MTSKSVVICILFLSVLFISEINSKLAKNKKFFFSSWEGTYRLKSENKEVLLWQDYDECKTACKDSCYSTHSYDNYKFLDQSGEKYWFCFEYNQKGWAKRYALNDNDRKRIYDNNHFREEDKNLDWSHVDYCDAYCLATQQEMCKILDQYDLDDDYDRVVTSSWYICKEKALRPSKNSKTKYPVKIIKKK